MNALTDGFGGSMSTGDLLALLTVVLGVVVVAGAGGRADRGAPAAREDLARARDARVARSRASSPSTCARSRARSRRSTRSSTSSSARCPASRARRRSWPRGGRDDPLWWIGTSSCSSSSSRSCSTCCTACCSAARSIVPSVERIAAAAAAGSKDLDATALLLTTQDQVAQTVAGVAEYGGSLDVILDDAS